MLTSVRPRYLLDTNILVAYVRGGNLGGWIEATYQLMSTPTAPIISVVTDGETRSLALQLGWSPARIRRLQALVQNCVSVQLDFQGVLDAYAMIDDRSRRIGRRMGKNDVWIAATAHVTGTLLLTMDQDFDHLHPSILTRELIDPASHP
jgi:tRNA(fMet)-specific endonuclease VapC